MSQLLFENNTWNFETIRKISDACEEIAVKEMGLTLYPNQIEVITAEQMLDAYSSIGMPLFYKHWSFGKHFAQQEMLYRKGLQGLAYEIVINSNPCISYLMEENTATMQALVISHAACGHNTFFATNYLFKQWTDASAILDYLNYAKHFIERCEEQHGAEKVEIILDAAHALMNNSVHRYPGKKPINLKTEREREEVRREYAKTNYNDLWRTLPPASETSKTVDPAVARAQALLGLPEENLLYFIEKHAPRLADWQREVLRIVRNIAQYFYPQQQTKTMNEGCATWVHYRIMNRLYELGKLSEGQMFEFLHSHTGVVTQMPYNSKYYSGINPYALGFEMMSDIERMIINPTDEDCEWFPRIAGRGADQVMPILRDIWANYRDESFISQFLSPHLMRKMRLFQLHDDPENSEYVVGAVHDDRGYKELRTQLSHQYDVGWYAPSIEIVSVDLLGVRKLTLHHKSPRNNALEPNDAHKTAQHLANLWGYRIELLDLGADDELLAEYSVMPDAKGMQLVS